MSDFSVLCTAVLDDLIANVEELESVERHSPAPWDPDRHRDDDKRHLACWPMGEAEQAAPEVQDGHVLTQSYALLYWEPAVEEGERDVSNDEAANALFDLHNKVRARFYIDDHQTIGDTPRVWYSSVTFPEDPGSDRWFGITFTALQYIAFTEEGGP